MIRMTNGEMIQKVFDCQVCEPLPEDDIIHVIFSDKNDSAIGFDWSWWSMEYKDPTAKNNLGVDCISRTRAIERLKLNFPISQGADNSRDRHRYMQALADLQAIKELPPVTPQPRKGHWMKSNIGGAKVCSVCNAHMGLSSFKFCPNCGAKMVEPQESEDKE